MPRVLADQVDGIAQKRHLPQRTAERQGFGRWPSPSAQGFQSGHQEDLTMSTSTSQQPAIARVWRGRVRRERSDEYEAYNYEVGIKPLIEIAMAVQTFREDR